MRIEILCRSKTRHHVPCFDAFAFLEASNKWKFNWPCPVCETQIQIIALNFQSRLLNELVRGIINEDLLIRLPTVFYSKREIQNMFMIHGGNGLRGNRYSIPWQYLSPRSMLRCFLEVTAIPSQTRTRKIRHQNDGSHKSLHLKKTLYSDLRQSTMWPKILHSLKLIIYICVP